MLSKRAHTWNCERYFAHIPFIAEVDDGEEGESGQHTDDDTEHDGQNEAQRVRGMRRDGRLLVRATLRICKVTCKFVVLLN